MTHALQPLDKPDTIADTQKLFGFKFAFDVPAFKEPNEWVPLADNAYQFDPLTTEAVLSGLAFNRRVLIQGFHGTGKIQAISKQICRAVKLAVCTN